MEINRLQGVGAQLCLKLLRKVAEGEDVVITRHGEPVARLVPVQKAATKRRLGALKGKLRIADDFDAPLASELLDLFEGKR